MRASRRAFIGLIVLLTLAAFGRVVGHPFVSLDDKQYVTTNSVVREGLTAAGLRWALTTFTAANWHPLTWLSHLTDVSLFGLAPGGHHATSLLLHTAAAVLLFFVLAGMTGAAGRSFFAATLFAVHPLHVESVAWVAERKDVLSGLFFVVTLAAWLRYVRRPGAGRYLAATAAFALGLTAKPMLVSLPFVLLLLDWWPLGRFRASRTALPAPCRERPSAGRLFLEKVPLLILTVASSVVTYVAQSAGNAVSGTAALALPWRLANAAVSYLRYLEKTVWPVDLAVFYPHPGRALPLWWGAASAAVLLLVTLAAIRFARRLPWWTVGWFWYLGMLVPVIGLLQAGSQGMADRYTYLPLIGIFITAVWGAATVARRFAWSPAVLHITGGMLLAFLTVGAFVQTGYWRDSVRLYTHASRVIPGNWLAAANLANEELRQGRWREAAARYEEVLKHRTDIAEISFSLGLARMNSGDLAGARAAYERALALRPAYPEAESNMGWILSREGRREEAAARYQRALALRPEFAEALVGLGVVREAQGRGGESTQLYRRAAAANPASAAMRFNLGTALAREGRLTEAEAEYRAAVALDPGLAAAHNNLGNLLFRQGRRPEALAELRKAAAALPDDPAIRANLRRIEP